MTKIRTDKLDTCTALLEDCIVGHFAGNSLQTTIHLSHSVLMVVQDLNKHYRDKLKIDLGFKTTEEQSLEDPAFKIILKSQTDINSLNRGFSEKANYLKHADKDPFAEATYEEGYDDEHRLSTAIKDHSNFVNALINQNRATNAAAILGLPERSKAKPRYLVLGQLFDSYRDEFESTSDPFWEQHNFEAIRLVTEELKAKYAEIIRKNDLWGKRSKYDELVLLDGLKNKVRTKLKGQKPKPTDPAR